MEHVVARRPPGLAQYHLRFPAGAVLRKEAPDIVIAPAIAAGADEDRRDVLELGLDAEPVGHLLAQAQAFRIAVLVRHEDGEDVARTEGSHAERRDHA